MEYIDLKEKLEKLFSEDLSNRTSLQDTRRNLFLNSCVLFVVHINAFLYYFFDTGQLSISKV